MSVDKYIKYKCDTCHRETEKKVDPIRPTIYKCNITYKCSGTLQKIGETSVVSKVTPKVAGLTNWRARGTSVTTSTATTAIPQIPVMDNLGRLAIAMKTQQASPYVLSMNSYKLDIISFSEYSYIRTGATTSIFGPDDSSQLLTLRFTALDVVKVFVNGVELDPLLYTTIPTSSTAPAEIDFNPALAQEYNAIDVIVYTQPTPTVKNFSFTQVLSVGTNIVCDTNSAWANVETIGIFNPSTGVVDTYYVYICEDITSLSLNDILSPTTNLTDVVMLIGHDPWSSYDRDLKTVVPLTTTTQFEYNKDEANRTILTVSEAVLTSVYPEISINSRCVIDAESLNTAVSSVTISNKYIV